MTSLSKNVYIDRLDGIVNKYNNEYHTTYIDKLMIKILNLKLVILLEYQKHKIISAKVYVPKRSGESFCDQKF